MNAMDEILILEKLGYRVVPEFVSFKNRWEIIIEPWDRKSKKRKPGRTKRTGFLFSTIEINNPAKNKAYLQKMSEVRTKLINHLNPKLTPEKLQS